MLCELENIAVAQRELTNSGEQPSNGVVVLVANHLVGAENTTPDALNNANLGGLLVLKLPQGEGKSAELLDNLGQHRPGGRALEAVGGSSAAMQSRPVAQSLDLSATQGDAHLDAPRLVDLGETLALGALTGSQDDLLLGLDLVVLELPDGGALDQVAVICGRDLLEHLGNLALGVGLLGLLLLLRAGRDGTRGNHEPQQELICVVGSQHQVGLAALNHITGANNDGVAHNGGEAIDLGAQLDLDGLASLQRRRSLLGVGLEGRVGGDVGAGGDGGAVADALGDLLALVDLGDLLLEQLVAALAKLDDVGALSAPSCAVLAQCGVLERIATDLRPPSGPSRKWQRHP